MSNKVGLKGLEKLFKAMDDPHYGRGGRFRFAQEINTTPQNVYIMQKQGRVPPKHIKTILRLMDEYGVVKKGGFKYEALDFL
jgi:hypothetical protein